MEHFTHAQASSTRYIGYTFRLETKLPQWSTPSNQERALIQEKMTDIGFRFTPTSALLKFETAAHNAVNETFPGIITKGCFFHYTQWIWRRAQATGLQIPYKDNEDVKLFVRRAAILPLVPLDVIEDVWFQALEDRDDANITQLTEQFTDYVTEQWVEGDRTLWNRFGTEGPRTTNNVEPNGTWTLIVAW